MVAYGRTPLGDDLSKRLVDVLTETLQCVQQALQPCPITGREHYLFSLRHMVTVIQSLRLVDPQIRNKPEFLPLFLKHELNRVIYDQIVREIDQNWFKDKLDEIFRNVIPSIPSDVILSRKHLLSFISRNFHLSLRKANNSILHFHWKDAVMNVR